MLEWLKKFGVIVGLIISLISMTTLALKIEHRMTVVEMRNEALNKENSDLKAQLKENKAEIMKDIDDIDKELRRLNQYLFFPKN